jgi:hypothetical protein
MPKLGFPRKKKKVVIEYKDEELGVAKNPGISSAPQGAQPPPEPQSTQPPPEPQGAQPPPEPQGAQPSPEPQGAQPSPEPQGAQPSPEQNKKAGRVGQTVRKVISAAFAVVMFGFLILMLMAIFFGTLLHSCMTY